MSAGSMVSGRIPVELRRRGDAALSKMGSTPSGLIRAAYEYVAETGQLPQANRELGARKRSLAGQDLAALSASISASTIAIPCECFEGKTDRELLEEALLEKHGEGFGGLS